MKTLTIILVLTLALSANADIHILDKGGATITSNYDSTVAMEFRLIAGAALTAENVANWNAADSLDGSGYITTGDYYTDRVWDYNSKGNADTTKMFIIGYDTLIVLDSVSCDSSWGEILTSEEGIKFYKNLRLDCDTFYTERIEPVYEKKIDWFYKNFEKLFELLKK